MVLTAEEQENIRKTVEEKIPEDFGITGKLWTLGRTRQYIQMQFHKAIKERTLSDYMKRWGMYHLPAYLLESLSPYFP